MNLFNAHRLRIEAKWLTSCKPFSFEVNIIVYGDSLSLNVNSALVNFENLSRNEKSRDLKMSRFKIQDR